MQVDCLSTVMPAHVAGILLRRALPCHPKRDHLNKPGDDSARCVCVALCRASTSSRPASNKDVDGRDKPGHDVCEAYSPIQLSNSIARSLGEQHRPYFFRRRVRRRLSCPSEKARELARQVAQPLFV